jgi:hypothetical protein
VLPRDETVKLCWAEVRVGQRSRCLRHDPRLPDLQSACTQGRRADRRRWPPLPLPAVRADAHRPDGHPLRALARATRGDRDGGALVWALPPLPPGRVRPLGRARRGCVTADGSRLGPHLRAAPGRGAAPEGTSTWRALVRGRDGRAGRWPVGRPLARGGRDGASGGHPAVGTP